MPVRYLLLLPVGVCAFLLDSHMDRPTVVALGAVVLVVAILVVRAAVDHVRFVRTLDRFATGGELGGMRVTYIDGVAPFVAGIARPRIYCDPGLVEALTARQQRAIALHEQHHVHRRDPLRLLVGRALRPFAALVPRLHAHLDAWEARLEIAADRSALRQGATRADIAGALLALLQHDRLRFGPGFLSVAELRLRALRGEVPPQTRERTAVVQTWLAAAAVVACVLVF